MHYRSFIFKLSFRIICIVSIILGLVYTIGKSQYEYVILITLSLTYILFNTYGYIKRRFLVLEDFFNAVKYRDFSRWFPDDTGPKDIQFLYSGFNAVNRSIKQINAQHHAQYVYLQKILEMVEIGIIAYNLETGNVLWANSSFGKTLDLPSFKNISFVKYRKSQLFETIFETHFKEPSSISVELQNERIKILISDTVFQAEEDAFKLIVIQNIGDTLNQNESESWKKLLSVMTHEIMNSIAPISSLADTLQQNLNLALDNPNEQKFELKDLHSGIKTIKNRSDGLIKFAKTYRSFNKVTKLNREHIRISELFDNIRLLMEPSLQSKNIDLCFKVSSPHLNLKIDLHLIEQVLINLLTNAVDACNHKDDARITVEASQKPNREIEIRVFDNGSGIPRDILENIFVPFFTSKATGSGIGLSLCKQIMLLHKGRILVKSIEGEGSVFKLIF